MNIAYLIQAHNQPLLLQRLIDRLNQPHISFFIHFDKKSKVTDSARELLKDYKNVQIISEYAVNWMGYTQVAAWIVLMKLAKASGQEFKYFVLMSGQDYPIKNNDEINAFYEQHTCDFLSFVAIKDLAQKFKNKVAYYHFYDVPYINPRHPAKIPFLVYLYFGGHKFMRKYAPTRKFYNGMEPYFGSNWFAITGETLSYILDFLEKNPGYISFMKYTEAPDETFFHTIIFNSERKLNIYRYDDYLRFLENRKEGERYNPEYGSLRYMDWSERGNKPKPAVLDNDYFNELAESKDLYARKVDEKASAELLDKIDRELLGYHPKGAS